MKRRAFLQKLGIGLVATAALAHIPASVIKRSEWLEQAGQRWASEKLYAKWLAVVGRTGGDPHLFRVSRDFLDLYESELQAMTRFVPYTVEPPKYRSLMFRGIIVREDPGVHGYDIACEFYTV